MFLKAGGNLTQGGLNAGFQNQKRAAPGQYGGTHEQAVAFGFDYRLAFPGQYCFIQRKLNTIQ